MTLEKIYKITIIISKHKLAKISNERKKTIMFQEVMLLWRNDKGKNFITLIRI